MRTASALFQSTPAIADGRTGELGSITTDYYLFQSTPAIADGRTAQTKTFMPISCCFNPRPPSLTGEPW